METEKHTVTIPISDYNELIGFKEVLKNNPAAKHLELLYRKGLLSNLNLEKEPVDLMVTNGMSFQELLIRFNYKDGQ